MASGEGLHLKIFLIEQVHGRERGPSDALVPGCVGLNNQHLLEWCEEFELVTERSWELGWLPLTFRMALGL